MMSNYRRPRVKFRKRISISWRHLIEKEKFEATKRQVDSWTKNSESIHSRRAARPASAIQQIPYPFNVRPVLQLRDNGADAFVAASTIALYLYLTPSSIFMVISRTRGHSNSNESRAAVSFATIILTSLLIKASFTRGAIRNTFYTHISRARIIPRLDVSWYNTTRQQREFALCCFKTMQMSTGRARGLKSSKAHVSARVKRG